MKPFRSLALLALALLSACSGSVPPASPPAGQSSAAPAGEGVTWDNIHSGPGGTSASAVQTEALSPSLLKGNTAPQVQSAQFVAGAGAGGDAVAVVATGFDPEGDPVTIEYAWTVNGQPAGSGDRLESRVRRGDFVTVTLTPFDGKERGRSVTLRSQVNNSPPAIAGLVDVQQANDSYAARIQAADPDGDPIRYFLVSGPAGMTVDPAEGTVKWAMPPGFTGKAVFSVSARDRSGAQSTYAATIHVTETFE